MSGRLPGICESEAVCEKAYYNEAAGEDRSSQGVSAPSLIFHTALLPGDFCLREGQHLYWNTGGGGGQGWKQGKVYRKRRTMFVTPNAA